MKRTRRSSSFVGCATSCLNELPCMADRPLAKRLHVHCVKARGRGASELSIIDSVPARALPQILCPFQRLLWQSRPELHWRNSLVDQTTTGRAAHGKGGSPGGCLRRPRAPLPPRRTSMVRSQQLEPLPCSLHTRSLVLTPALTGHPIDAVIYNDGCRSTARCRRRASATVATAVASLWRI